MNVWLDLTDLTEFSFPRISDPRECGNLSDWHEAIVLVKRLQDGIDDLEDLLRSSNMNCLIRRRGSACA